MSDHITKPGKSKESDDIYPLLRDPGVKLETRNYSPPSFTLSRRSHFGDLRDYLGIARERSMPSNDVLMNLPPSPSTKPMFARNHYADLQDYSRIKETYEPVIIGELPFLKKTAAMITAKTEEKIVEPIGDEEQPKGYRIKSRFIAESPLTKEDGLPATFKMQDACAGLGMSTDPSLAKILYWVDKLIDRGANLKPITKALGFVSVVSAPPVEQLGDIIINEDGGSLSTLNWRHPFAAKFPLGVLNLFIMFPENFFKQNDMVPGQHISVRKDGKWRTPKEEWVEMSREEMQTLLGGGIRIASR